MHSLASPVRILDGSCDPVDQKIPPSISQLFRTNSVLSPVDTQCVHQLLEVREAGLAAFAEEIERTHAQALSLELQCERANGIVHELEALAPVHRIPTDIMAKVFEHCVAEQPAPKVNSRTTPLLLGQVCRSWRHLLFSLPCLWSSLQLDLPATSSDWGAVVQSKSLAMHVWLSRSKALPFSLFLNHPKGSFIPWHALVHLDKEILALSYRLKALALHFPSRSLSSLLTFTHNSLPYLEHLELQNTNPLPTNQDPPPVVLHSAPNLKSLSLSWCSVDLCDFQIPWAQLRHLNLEYDASPFWNPVHSDYLQTLARCPNLTTLYLGIGAPIDDAGPALIEPVTLPRVHTFKSSLYVQTQYLVYFFDALRMPQLRHFAIKNVSLSLGGYTGQTECLPFLERCADTLESVSFSRLDIADTAVLSCIARMPRLTTMSFLPGVLRLNHGFLTALAHDEGERICPVLEALHLRCPSTVPVDAITHLVASRCQTTFKLKQFSLQLASFDYGLDARDEKIAEVQAQLKEYVEGGLQLVLTKSSSSG